MPKHCPPRRIGQRLPAGAGRVRSGESLQGRRGCPAVFEGRAVYLPLVAEVRVLRRKLRTPHFSPPPRLTQLGSHLLSLQRRSSRRQLHRVRTAMRSARLLESPFTVTSPTRVTDAKLRAAPPSTASGRRGRVQRADDDHVGCALTSASISCQRVVLDGTRTGRAADVCASICARSLGRSSRITRVTTPSLGHRARRSVPLVGLRARARLAALAHLRQLRLARTERRAPVGQLSTICRIACR